MTDTVKLGISTCLTGENVRWNKGHKRDPYLTDTLGLFVEYIPVCPEVEAGFGVPREPMRLVGDPQSPKLITTNSRKDNTDQMMTWVKNRVKQLEKQDLCGFIFKSGSPSSGMINVKVYSDKGMPVKKGVGLFARAFMDHFPLIPAEDDGRLHDPAIRENFITRVFTLQRWRKALSKKKRMGSLVDFHTRHKLLILSRSQKHARQMGKLVAAGKQLPIHPLFVQYEKLLMEALSLNTTVKKNVNVLQHLMGYFKKQLTADEKKECMEIFESYQKELVPLIVPLTLINHYTRKYDQPYLKSQVYLHPHPIELKLRTHL